MTISVIICTKGPCNLIFPRVIRSVATQTFPPSKWEVLIVDNAPSQPLNLNGIELLHSSRVVRETRPGLIHARIRGIVEAAGDLLVFADDDNILSPDYLEQASLLSEAFPQIGVFGGRVLPEFAEKPPAWLQPFTSHLGLSDFNHDQWANIPGDRGVTPCGAGLCVRRAVAVNWVKQVCADRRRLSLGRVHENTMSGEDADLVYTCIAGGWGAGLFKNLSLTHVIPAKRLQFSYQRRLARGIGWSHGRLLQLRGWNTVDRRVLAWAKIVHFCFGREYPLRARVIGLEYVLAFIRGLSQSSPRSSQ